MFWPLCAYIAITEQEVDITPNPISGTIEHLTEWVDLESEMQIGPYLKDAIEWALKK